MSEKEKLEGIKAEKAPKEKKAKSADKKPGVFARIAKWLRELKSELKKVQWPSKKQTVNNTLVVIACVLIVGVCIWVFDAVALRVVNALLHLAGKG